MTSQKATEKLLQATLSGKISDAQAALAAGADLNARDDRQRTPLHLAAKNGDTDLARWLIDKGAALGARDQWQWTLLHRAAANGHIDNAQLLIEKAQSLTPGTIGNRRRCIGCRSWLHRHRPVAAQERRRP